MQVDSTSWIIREWKSSNGHLNVNSCTLKLGGVVFYLLVA